MPLNLPGVPFKLTAEDMGVPNIGAAIRSGLENYRYRMQNRAIPEQLAQDLLRSKLDNKIKQSQIERLPYAQKLDALRVQQMERQLDPEKQRAYIQSLLNRSPQPQEQQQTMGLYAGQGMPSTEELESPTSLPEQQKSPQGLNLQNLQPEQMMALQMAGIKLPSMITNPFQGLAREAYDLQRLENMYGKESPVVQRAKELLDIKKRSQQSLEDIRQRQISGLRPGEKEFYDPQTGKPLGREAPTTAAEAKEISGRTMFMDLAPKIIQGGAPYIGQNSINNLFKDAKQYGLNPVATKKIDDLLLSISLNNATAVKENATLGAPNVIKNIDRLIDTLKGHDIPQKIESFVKQFKLPGSAQTKAKLRAAELINLSTHRGMMSVPATRKKYYDPKREVEKIPLEQESQFEESFTPQLEFKNQDEFHNYMRALTPEQQQQVLMQLQGQ